MPVWLFLLGIIMEFIIANEDHIPVIFSAWKETKQRMMGLDQSIKDGMVWIALSATNELIGFIRVNDAAGKTLDYLKISEMYITDYELVILYDIFFREIDNVIMKYGYNKAKVNVVLKRIERQMVKSFWKKEGEKYKFSASGKTYSKSLYIKEISTDKYVDISEFGELI